MVSKMGADVLPRWERLLYLIGGIGSIAYCFFSFYKETHAALNTLQTQSGIKWLGGIKDLADLEWSDFLHHLIPKLVPLLVGHTLLGQLLFRLQLKIWLQKSVRLLYDILAISYLFGVRASLLLMVESIFMYLVTFQRYTLVVWIVALLFTTTLNIESVIKQQLNITGYTLNENVTFFVSISYAHIRLLCTSIEMIKIRYANQSAHSPTSKFSGIHSDHKKGSDKDENSKYSKGGKYSLIDSKTSIIDFFSYVFYLPVFFTGPILTFDEFSPQLTAFYLAQKHHIDIKGIAKRLIKIIFYALFIELQFHFIYLVAVHVKWKMVKKLSVPAVVGLGVLQGQFFHLKYLCIFGTGSIFSTLDGLTPPPPPACITWVYSFSDMWRYFDVGLYNFIKKYIYIPCGGSKAGFPRQICGVGLAFAFIYYWHGADLAVLVWCCGNFVIVLLEMSAYRLESSTLGSKLKISIGPAVEQRLRGLIAVPLYLASSLQVMYFFFSMRTGTAMVKKLVWGASLKTLLLEYICFYFAIQNAMYARKWVMSRKSS